MEASKVRGVMNINEAILAVIEDAPDSCYANQARMYAEHAMRAAVDHGMDGLQTQVLYILSNLQHWRGTRAREVKKAMKDWLKETDKQQ